MQSIANIAISISESLIGSKNNAIVIAKASNTKKNMKEYHLQVKIEQRNDGV